MRWHHLQAVAAEFFNEHFAPAAMYGILRLGCWGTGGLGRGGCASGACEARKASVEGFLSRGGKHARMGCPARTLGWRAGGIFGVAVVRGRLSFGRVRESQEMDGWELEGEKGCPARELAGEPGPGYVVARDARGHVTVASCSASTTASNSDALLKAQHE
jgi:hypothetical protein